MITATTRFVDLPWYAATLDLTSSYAWKPYIRKVEARRSNGTGFDTFTGAAFPSLTSLVAGMFYRLDLKNLPAGGITIDNGSPSAAAQLDYEFYEIPSGTATIPEIFVEELTVFGFRYGEPVLTNASGGVESGVVTFQLNDGAIVSYQDFNGLLAKLVEHDFSSGDNSYVISVNVASGAAATLKLPIL